MIEFIAAALAAAQPAPADFASYSVCRDAHALINQPCTLLEHFDPASATRVVGGRNNAWWLHRDALTMIARPTATPWVMLCCSIQTGLVPIAGTDLAGVTVRIPHLEEAVLDVKPAPGDQPSSVYRGPKAPAAPARSDPLKGILVSRDFSSENLHDRRAVWFYLPPNVPADAHLPVIYMADGGALSFAPIAEALILAGTIRPIILVGIEAARPSRPHCFSEDCDLRGKEYEAGRDGTDAPFQRHMRFLVDEVMPYVAAHYPASNDRLDRVVAGVSQGSVWAAQTAEIRPDLFGAAIVLSGTSAVERTPASLRNSRVFTGAGEFEAERLGAMRHFGVVARAAHADVRIDSLWAGHSPLAWDIMLTRAVQWLFPNIGR